MPKPMPATKALLLGLVATFLLSPTLARAGTPKAKPSPTLTFAVLSDIHLDLGKLKIAFEDLRARRITTAVLVGDHSDGQAQEYAQFTAFLASTAHPAKLFFTMGNHEYYGSYHKDGGPYDETGFPNGETSAACRARFNRFRGAAADGPVYYDARVNGFHFIFLGGERSRMDDPALLDDAVLTQAQLDWLEARLGEDGPGDKPVFLFLHQPFLNTVSGSRALDDGSLSIRPEAGLRRILAGHPNVYFFSGHTHWQLDMPATHRTDPTGFQMFNTSSVHDPYNAKDEPIAAPMCEGLTVSVRGSRVRVTGRDFLGRRDLPGQSYAFFKKSHITH